MTLPTTTPDTVTVELTREEVHGIILTANIGLDKFSILQVNSFYDLIQAYKKKPRLTPQDLVDAAGHYLNHAPIDRRISKSM